MNQGQTRDLSGSTRRLHAVTNTSGEETHTGIFKTFPKPFKCK